MERLSSTYVLLRRDDNISSARVTGIRADKMEGLRTLYSNNPAVVTSVAGAVIVATAGLVVYSYMTRRLADQDQNSE